MSWSLEDLGLANRIRASGSFKLMARPTQVRHPAFSTVSLMKLARLMKTFSMLCLLFPLLQAGCGSATPQRGSASAAEYQRIVERTRGIVAKQLDLAVQEVDVDVPLSQLKKPADELDVIEIIMNVEEEFSIEIKDDEVVIGNLSVKALANIVSRKKS